MEKPQRRSRGELLNRAVSHCRITRTVHVHVPVVNTLLHLFFRFFWGGVLHLGVWLTNAFLRFRDFELDNDQDALRCLSF